MVPATESKGQNVTPPSVETKVSMAPVTKATGTCKMAFTQYFSLTQSSSSAMTAVAQLSVNSATDWSGVSPRFDEFRVDSIEFTYDFSRFACIGGENSAVGRPALIYAHTLSTPLGAWASAVHHDGCEWLDPTNKAVFHKKLMAPKPIFIEEVSTVTYNTVVSPWQPVSSAGNLFYGYMNFTGSSAGNSGVACPGIIRYNVSLRSRKY